MNTLFEQLVSDAAVYASEKHERQARKYTGEPYFNHLIDVAMSLMWVGCSTETVAAGFLHDVIEDQNVTVDELKLRFGTTVARLVDEVTDVSKPSDGNRRVRKALDREHLRNASPEAKSIKLADIISNVPSIRQHAPGFAVKYDEEKRLLLPFLSEGNHTLYEHAKKIVFNL